MQTTRHIVGARHGDAGGGVTVVVALGPWSQPTCLVGADGGGQASRKVPSLDRPQDLLPHVQLLRASCLHALPFYSLPLACSCPAGFPGPPATSSNQMALPGFPEEAEPVWGPP